ncbi:hypothetical protein HYW76_05075 [Candidatus Pacearchaeota archaeon]|nr:hypothetical protein [Candidatus Pacearchaeota archaeon]
MIKLKLFYDKNLKQIKIPSVLKSSRNRIVSNFIFDTGSPHTILNYSDSLRLGIPHVTKSEIIRMGGRVYQSYIFNNFEIIFKSPEKEIIKEILPVRVLKPNSLKMERIEEMDRFPNILGIDFLEKGYKFVCDIVNEEIYLEKEELKTEPVNQYNNSFKPLLN